MVKGSHHTEEWKRRMSVVHKGQNTWSKGKPLSEEHRKKLSEAHKGKNTWTKGRHWKLSEETKQKMSKAGKGRIFTKEWREKISKALTGNFVGNKNPFYGRRHTEETKRKISEKRKGRNSGRDNASKRPEVRKKISESKKGEKNPAWKGGITPITQKIRHFEKYNQWRQDCFIRDDFTCQRCKIRGKNLEVHHKKPFWKLLEEVKKYLPLYDLYEGVMIYSPLWDIDNGITLCKKCHNKTKKYNKHNKGG